MKIKHICFIVPNYPTKNDPMYTFVRELVVSISKLGIKCSVIAPQSITNFIFKKNRKRPFMWQDKVDSSATIDVYQPIHFPFLNIKIMGNNVAGSLTSDAIKYVFYRYKLDPDILYAHFWHSGVIAAEISIRKQIPVFVTSGESKIWVDSLYSRSRINKATERVKGVICVSGKNLEESIELGLCKRADSIVIPNAINNSLFFKKDKSEVRKKLSLDSNDFIIVFTGAFSHRKGVMRVVKAIEGLDDVKALFIGSGDQQPKGEKIAFSGRLPHNQIIDYLNAADVFVLPTLAEGCCNAIIEAMACGLPVISSNLSFNDEILNDKNSIRVNPNSIEEIRDAINALKNNKVYRDKLAAGSMIMSRELNIEKRAEKIINFMIEMVKKHDI